MRSLAKWAMVCLLFSGYLNADQRFIVQVSAPQVLNVACLSLGCTVVNGLGDPLGQLFLTTIPDSFLSNLFITLLSAVPGILDVERDLQAQVTQTQPPVPAALYDQTPVSYYGVTVHEGYVLQPATQIIGLQNAQATFQVAGATTVAVIDTGVDPTHPVLSNVLLPGYDFTRNRTGGSEMGDTDQSTAAVVDGSGPTDVSGTSVALVDQPTASNLNQPGTADFGHGTMVAGVVHLVAPGAMIMPLKAFAPNGTGYTSNIISAIYYATLHGARVLNMSFSLAKPSYALELAVDYATLTGSICVASAGNNGQRISVYPAAYSNVIGVASTTNNDTRSSFSNYGTPLVWVAAPGEGIVTTYPFGTYAASWGTSFSAPFVSGTVALMFDGTSAPNYSSAAAALSHAQTLTPDLGNGRLDVSRALQAFLTGH
jgi:subtilisin family serine protease